MRFDLIKKANFIFFFAASLTSAIADDCFGLQDRITEVFNQKKTAVVRVFGYDKSPGVTNDGSKQQVNVGTGFFISCEGLIMTIANIVNETQSIWVEYNGVTYPAELVGCDKVTDIAIIRLLKDDSSVPFFHLGESMEVPEPSVLLLGITCKFGQEPGPSLGMVAGWHTLFFDTRFPTTYLRSSIPLDGGEAGSPVFDLMGRFVGVMVISMDVIRSSFIIPARAVMRIRDDLVFSGKVSYACLGIYFDQEASMASGSYIIGEVLHGGSAYDGGLRSGDKILEFDNAPIIHLADLQNSIFFARPGQVLSIKVQRGDKELKLPIRLGEEPSPQEDKTKERQHSLSVPTGFHKGSDVPNEIKLITQRGNFWRNYFKG